MPGSICVLTTLLAIAADQASDARRLVQAFDENAAAFRRGDFRFTYEIGSAATLQDARDGAATARSRADGQYVFANGVLRYDRIAPQAIGDDRVQMGPRKAGGASMSFRCLSDRKITMIDDIDQDASRDSPSHLVRISPGGLDAAGLFDFPLAIGMERSTRSDPIRYLREAVRDDGRNGAKSRIQDVRAEVDGTGQDLVHVRGTSGTVDWTYTFDTKRGTIPVRAGTTSRRTGRIRQVEYDDVRQVESGWLPFRKTMWTNAGPLFTRLVVLSHRPEAEVTRSAFELDFDDPVPVYDEVKNVYYTARRRWTIHSLPGPGSNEIVKVGETKPVTEPMMPGERSPWPHRPWIILASAGLALAAAGGWRRWGRGKA